MKYFSAVLFFLVIACANNADNSAKNKPAMDSTEINNSVNNNDSLPAPFATKSVKEYCKVIGWPAGKMPVAPDGFQVSKFADGFYNPRFIYAAENGDVFIAEANTELKGVKKVAAKFVRAGKSQNLGESANRITLLRGGINGAPLHKYNFLEGLNQPFGILTNGNKFYVANTDGLMEYDYHLGDTIIKSAGKKIVDLPAGGYNNHWTRNIILNDKKDKIYISVGSGSNVGEHGIANEIRRADVLEVNLDGSGEKIVASGLRNPAGLSINPETKKLWAAVNERDELGDELVPDYITSVKDGGFYGWPYSYFGNHLDPRMKDSQRLDLVSKAIVPDYAVGAHTASLGLTFYTGTSFPDKYKNGAFVSQHGSWNRSQLAGYKVVFVPFKNGMPAGKMEDFVTGFISDPEKKEVFGRPVGMAILKDGSMLLADDASNIILRIQFAKK